MKRILTLALVLVSLLLSGAIFGFFYAWVCSTMWGLDMADPRVAIPAMQAMNASVRNAVFAPAFFGTPIALIATALVLWIQRQRTAATCFGLGGVVYFGLGLVLTMTINVPMNLELAAVTVPDDIDSARQIWVEYSQPWQFWNQMRTIASGGAFLIALVGAILLKSSTAFNA